MKGIDVSFSQAGIDWRQVKASGKVDFAIIRAGYGRYASQKDEYFEDNYEGAKAAGIPVGAYWYSYATTEADAVQEAQACLECIRNKTFEYPIYFDFEEDSQLRLGRAKLSAIIKAFCDTLEKAGYFVGVYSMKSALESHLTDEVRSAYTIWCAHINVNHTSYTGHDMWQYSWTGSIPGIKGDVDLDECYRDFPTIIKSAGLNGFEKPEMPYTPGMTPADVARIPYIPGMTAGDVQTYIRWVTCLGAGDYADTEDGFRAFLRENT